MKIFAIINREFLQLNFANISGKNWCSRKPTKLAVMNIYKATEKTAMPS